MIFNANKNDLALLASIAEYEMLTVGQLSALTQRRRKDVRRRLRVLESKRIIVSKERGYGRSRWRPEPDIFDSRWCNAFKEYSTISKKIVVFLGWAYEVGGKISSGKLILV